MLYLLSNYSIDLNNTNIKNVIITNSILNLDNQLFNNYSKNDVIYINFGIIDIEYFYENNLDNKIFEYYCDYCIKRYRDFIKNKLCKLVIVKVQNNQDKLKNLVKIFNNKLELLKNQYLILNQYEVIQKNSNIIKSNPVYKSNMLAIYTYNFGDYRDEIKNLDILNVNYNFNYYFYTEKNIVSEKWNVIKFDLIPELDFISSSRLTTKYIKYKHIPDELKPYKYILHIDCRRIKYLNKIDLNSILQKLESSDISYYCRKHPFNKNLNEEFEFIKKKNMENYTNLKNWINFIRTQNFKQTITHLENCIYIRDISNSKLNIIFNEVYEYILKFKLNRDQLVFIYLLQKYNFFNFKILDEFNL